MPRKQRKAIIMENQEDEKIYNQTIKIAKQLNIDPPTKIFTIVGRAFICNPDIQEKILEINELTERLSKHFDVLEDERVAAERAAEMEALRKENPKLWQNFKDLEAQSEKLYLENEKRKQEYIAAELQTAFEAGKMAETLEKLESADKAYWERQNVFGGTAA